MRNLRAAETGELRLGRRTEMFRGRELSDEEKVPVLRAYLKRRKVEVGPFFDGSDPTPATFRAAWATWRRSSPRCAGGPIAGAITTRSTCRPRAGGVVPRPRCRR